MSNMFTIIKGVNKDDDPDWNYQVLVPWKYDEM